MIAPTPDTPPEPDGFTAELSVIADGYVTHPGGIVCDTACPYHGEAASR